MDIGIASKHQHWTYPKGSSPTGCGTGIDTFVVVDVHSLLFEQPMSRNRLTDEPISSNTLQKERKSFREKKKEKLTY